MAIALRHPNRATSARTTNDTAVADGQTTAQPSRTRVAAARGASAVGSVMIGIARLVRLAVAVVVVIIVAAIVLRVLGANASNTIVSHIHDAAKWLVGPFDNMFSISKPKVSIAVNWGLAALVYLIVGSLIARLIARAAPRPVVSTTD
jgi:H+/gluconate symporter-like permease